MTREAFLESLGAALAAREQMPALRELLLTSLSQGADRAAVMSWLDEGRDIFPEGEDAILETMDQLEEWRGPRGD